MGGQRKIIHVDMDCFFAQVELKDRPDLKGKPVAVGGEPSKRGVISAADYVAREYGVRSALSSAQALKLCPHLTILPHSFEKYREASRTIREVFKKYTSIIEPLSLDEAFLDVSQNRESQGSATLLAQKIRADILRETGLTSSAGIAANKFLAKIASDWKKPNGQFTVSPDIVDLFMKDLPVKKIFGVGKVTAEKMHKMGIYTCGDLQAFDLMELVRRFGSWGGRLYELSRGVDHRPVSSKRDRKSFSVERTFNRDIFSVRELEVEVRSIYKEFEKRWTHSSLPQMRIRGSVVKVKFADFKQTTHECGASQLPSFEDFYKLFVAARSKYPDKSIRLIGVGVKLISSDEYELATAQLPLVPSPFFRCRESYTPT
ncbi:DNA polymerase IV [Bdellovibrionales bacterium]|nr:DNA polymerase IV [Bdellovibrionales bacterium]MDC0980299.1 DNA polymerase IV [Bdellovibrionales bacterium]